MSQINQDDDQNYVLGVVGAIILAVLIGVVSLSINVSDSSNTNTSNQSSKNTPAIFMGNFDFVFFYFRRSIFFVDVKSLEVIR